MIEYNNHKLAKTFKGITSEKDKRFVLILETMPSMNLTVIETYAKIDEAKIYAKDQIDNDDDETTYFTYFIFDRKTDKVYEL